MRLKPRFLPSVAALVVCLVTARLGVWQIQRYATSAEIAASMTAAWELDPLTALHAVPPETLRFRRASLRGRWVPGSGALVRGTPISGMPGYELVSLLALEGGEHLLVDRGWVRTDVSASEIAALHPPEGSRADDVLVEGLLVPMDGTSTLRATTGPDGVTRWPLEMDLLWGVFPRAVGLPYASMAAAAGVPVAPVALCLGPRLDEETERRATTVPAPGYVLPLPRTHHLSYAAQWFAFCAFAAVLWLWHHLSPRSETADG